MIQFETTEIESFLSSSNVAASDYKASLRLYETKGTSGLSETYTVAAYPLSESWEEGVGKEADVPKTTEGCSWKYRKNRDGASEISWASPGGTFIADDEATQSFNLEKPDINMDVTSIVQKWLNGVAPSAVGMDWKGGSCMGNSHDSQITSTEEADESDREAV